MIVHSLQLGYNCLHKKTRYLLSHIVAASVIICDYPDLTFIHSPLHSISYFVPVYESGF